LNRSIPTATGNDDVIPFNVEGDVLKVLAKEMIRPSAYKMNASPHPELITTKAARILFCTLFSTFFEIYLTNSKGKFEINDTSVLRAFVKLTMTLASKNPDEPFRLILEYSGPKYIDKSIEMMGSEIYKKISHLIGLFAEEVLQHTFRNKDRNYLAAGHPELLGKSSEKAVHIFMDNYVVPKIKDAFTNLSIRIN